MAQQTPRMKSVSLPPIEGGDDAAWANAASMAELGVLTASLLHELRQPLFAIKAHAQLGRQPACDVAARGERLGKIVEQVEHIEALLRYYGGFGQSPEPEALFDLNDPVKVAIEMLAHKARKVGAPIEAELAGVGLPILGREVAARQVAINLLQNAVDAVEGRPRPRVIVRTRDGGSSVRLEVEDNGPGVPADLVERMFEPFVTTKPPGRGTGLGLYISRKLVDEARGELRVAAVAGGGTRFEVELPKA